MYFEWLCRFGTWIVEFLKAGWWSGISALATVGAALGIVWAVKQLRFDAWLKAQEIFVEKDFLKARKQVFRHLESNPLPWDSNDESKGLLVCRRLDEFCRLVPYFAFRKSRAQKLVLRVWEVPLGRLWGLLDPLVKAERDKVEWQTKWNEFESLGQKALLRLSEDEQKRLLEVSESLIPEIRQLMGVHPANPISNGRCRLTTQ